MSFQPQFRDATRGQAKACVLITGTTGKGKSGLALMMGYYLAGKDWTKEYAVDTEKRSLDLFNGIRMHTADGTFNKFKKVDLTEADGYRPSHYLACVNHAIQAGAESLVLDSITHMWQQKDGMLQLKQQTINNSGGKLNNWTAWGTEEMIHEKNCILQCIRNEDIHIISTGRMKMKRELIDGTLVEMGMELQQMPDLEFEYDLVLDMISPGGTDGTPPRARVTKTRYAIFTKDQVYDFTDTILKGLVDYLDEGIDIAEIHENQRQERIAGLKQYLDSNASARAIYPTVKQNCGLEGKDLDSFTLEEVRQVTQIIMS